MHSATVQSRDSFKSALQNAARKAGIALDSRFIACAASEKGAIAQMYIKGATKFSDADVEQKNGIDMFFLYFEPPRGRPTVVPKALPAGFYTVNITLNAQNRSG